jgi:hypothetical protein
VRGDYLVLDNARVHHAEEAGALLKIILDIAGVRLLYLPAYRYLKLASHTVHAYKLCFYILL